MPSKRGAALETLADYVRRKKEENGSVSNKEIERRSGGARVGISAAYVNDILQGNARNITVEKLQALARSLPCSEEEIFRVVRGLPIQGLPADLSDSDILNLCLDFNSLNDKDQGELRAMVDMLHREIRHRLLG